MVKLPSSAGVRRVMSAMRRRVLRYTVGAGGDADVVKRIG